MVLIHRGEKKQRYKKRGDDESIRFLRKQEEKMSRYRREGVRRQAFPLDAKTQGSQGGSCGRELASEG